VAEVNSFGERILVRYVKGSATYSSASFGLIAPIDSYGVNFRRLQSPSLSLGTECRKQCYHTNRRAANVLALHPTTASRARKGLPGHPSSSPTPINRMHDSRDITTPFTKQPTNNLCYFFRLANPAHRRHPYSPVHGPLSGTGTSHHGCIDYPTTCISAMAPRPEKLYK
jgi:hypothetical protein